ncbi:hypothetical protein G7054_g3188 [Neopestalotiopsis clavispora]|nr:hypothetical protein G7054_g3188 [Neopestalotiopsis clavispora]
MDEEDERNMSSERLKADVRSPVTDNTDTPMPSKTESQEDAGISAAAVMDEIQALKEKLSQLERLSKAQPSSADEDEPPQSGLGAGHSFQEPEKHLVKQMEEYRRMEQCLYNHRKEWEISGGLASWGYNSQRSYYRQNRRKVGFPGEFIDENEYQRPDPFDPSHQCSTIPHTSVTAGLATFDHAINFSDRRERLRRNFEWDLDRLYLAEETDKRRLVKVAEDEAKRKRAEAVAKSDTHWNIEVKEPMNRLRRIEWVSFQESSSLVQNGACTIDILIGEPVITNTSNPWYTSSRRVGKSANTEIRPASIATRPGYGQLPERIRIWRKVEEGSDSDFVLLRPFKSLTYCEKDLRDWHSALEKKFLKRQRTRHIDAASIPHTQVSVSAGVNESEDFSSLKQGETEPANEALKPALDSRNSATGETGFEKLQEDQGKAEDSDGDDIDDGNDDETQTEGAKEHIQTLLDFIDTEISARRGYLYGPSCKKIYFSDLWHLFRPGMDVIENNGKQVYRVVKVSSARHRVVPAWQMYWSKNDDQKKQSPFKITCVYIDFNGKELGPVKTVFAFPRFNSEREVTSLPVYPIRFHPHRRSDFSDSEWRSISDLPESQRLKAKHILRGKKFMEVYPDQLLTSLILSGSAGPTVDGRDEIESQIVVDFETALSIKEQQHWKPDLQMLMEDQEEDEEEDRLCNAECCLNQNVHDDQYIDEKQKSEYIVRVLPGTGGADAPPSLAIIPRLLSEIETIPGAENHHVIPDEDLLIMSYRVFGFVLRNRRWAQLDLTYMTDLYTSDEDEILVRDDGGQNAKRKTAFDRLVLEEGHKDMISSLTAQHFRDKDSATLGPREQVDIVKGKGKGLIILLHGAPGVGKTSTAEGIAEVFKRPLFQITCGDLGTTAKEVESALETNFTLANKWGCILLLDEADVFLAQRTKEDFVRNGLVAVFLRVMEYYSGVLFLTTNRVGDFDEAFTSRIHVSLYYPELNQKKTRDVFQINLEMIKERFRKKNRVINIERDEIIDFARDNSEQTKWNGRQIRNACQTALALAEYDAQGGSYDQLLKPDREDAPVELKVNHFEKVQKAYMEFTDYIEDVYGTNTARRAKEHQLRAIEKKKGNTVNTEAGRTDFAAAANARPYAGVPGSAPIQSSYPAPAYPSASGYQQQAASGMQQPMYGQYSGMPNAYASQGHPSQFSGNTAPNQAMMGTNVFHANQAIQNRGMQQSSPAQQAQQLAENQQNSQQQAYLHQQAQALHASGQSGGVHQIPPQVAGFAEGFPVQQQWSQGPTNG